MFDFSFGEIFVIAVVAVIFLGPDKLPQTFVKIAKFLRAVKKTINDAKDTLDREIHITEMKQDALEYKKKFADSAEKLKNEILQDADVEGIKREIEGAKSAAILNESLENSSISFDEVESKGKAVQARLKSNLKQKNAESSLDSAKSQNLGEKHCHSERSEESKKNPSLRANPQDLRGNPPYEKTQNLQSGLPRSHLLARNDEILDSSLHKCSAQNDKIKKSAESSKKSKKSAPDSAKAQNLVKNNPSLRDSAKQNRGNPQGFARAVARSNHPPCEKTQNLQGRLPRSHLLARNDEILLGSANKKPKKSPNKSSKRAKNARTKTNGSN